MSVDPLVAFALVTLVALAFGIIASRFKQNTSLGYILAGIVLGPLVLGFLVPGTGVSGIFSDLGLIMILFYLGLELNLKRIREAGAVPFILAIAHLTVAFFAGFAVGSFFGLSPVTAGLAGAIITASSTVMVARFILDRGILQEHHARIALSILVLEDFFGIFVLVLLSSISAQKSLNVYVLNGLLFVIAMFFIVSKVSKYVLQFLHSLGHRDKMVFYAIGVGVISAYVGEYLGLSTTLGAYFAGFALAESMYGESIKDQLGVFREFFLVFFFANFGSTLFFDPTTGAAIAPTLIGLIPIVALALALTITYVLASMLAFLTVGTAIGLDKYTAAGVATLMVPLGEFVIIISTAAAPLLPHDQWTLLVTAGFLTILFTAPLGPYLYDRRKQVADWYASILPPNAQAMLSSSNRRMQALSKMLDNPVMQDQYVQAVERMIKNLIIAFSIVYIGALLSTSLQSNGTPSVLSIPNEVAIGFVLLLIVTWPLYRFLAELRFLVEEVSRNLIRSSFPAVARSSVLLEDEVAEVFTGFLLTAIGVAATAAVYFAFNGQEPLFVVVPFAFTMLALMQFSRSFYALIEHFEPLGDFATGEEEELADTDPRLSSLKRDFEENSRRFSTLHSEREALKEQVREALAAKDFKRVRLLLSTFRSKQEKLIRGMSRHAPRGNLPGMVRPADSRQSVENYLLRHAAQLELGGKPTAKRERGH